MASRIGINLVGPVFHTLPRKVRWLIEEGLLAKEQTLTHEDIRGLVNREQYENLQFDLYSDAEIPFYPLTSEVTEALEGFHRDGHDVVLLTRRSLARLQVTVRALLEHNLDDLVQHLVVVNENRLSKLEVCEQLCVHTYVDDDVECFRNVTATCPIHRIFFGKKMPIVLRRNGTLIAQNWRRARQLLQPLLEEPPDPGDSISTLPPGVLLVSSTEWRLLVEAGIYEELDARRGPSSNAPCRVLDDGTSWYLTETALRTFRIWLSKNGNERKRFYGLFLDMDTGEVRGGSHRFSLSRLEKSLLCYVMLTFPGVCRRADLEAITSSKGRGGLDERMSKLRRKLLNRLGHTWVGTERGVGYRFDPQEEQRWCLILGDSRLDGGTS